MKRDEKPVSSLHRTNEIDTSDDTFVLDNEDIAVLEDAISDAQHLTPPPSPPRKQKVSEIVPDQVMSVSVCSMMKMR